MFVHMLPHFSKTTTDCRNPMKERANVYFRPDKRAGTRFSNNTIENYWHKSLGSERERKCFVSLLNWIEHFWFSFYQICLYVCKRLCKESTNRFTEYRIHRVDSSSRHKTLPIIMWSSLTSLLDWNAKINEKINNDFISSMNKLMMMWDSMLGILICICWMN